MEQVFFGDIWSLTLVELLLMSTIVHENVNWLGEK